jgi:hypothetical protein
LLHQAASQTDVEPDADDVTVYVPHGDQHPSTQPMSVFAQRRSTTAPSFSGGSG